MGALVQVSRPRIQKLVMDAEICCRILGYKNPKYIFETSEINYVIVMSGYVGSVVQTGCLERGTYDELHIH